MKAMKDKSGSLLYARWQVRKLEAAWAEERATLTKRRDDAVGVIRNITDGLAKWFSERYTVTPPAEVEASREPADG